MPDYRPVPEDQEDDHARIARYAFDAESGPFDPEEADTDDSYWSFADYYGMFEGDELLTTSGHIEFTARLRGNWVSLAGVAAVASPPEHRRKGLVADLLAASLSDYRERGWPISALRPFEESFYAKYGWATGVRYRTATVEPGALAPTAELVGDEGRFRQIHPEDHERLHDAYDAWLEGTTLATRRSDDWWRDRILVSPHGEDPFCYAWERDGEVRGYVVYEVTDDRTLQTQEVAAADDEAYLHLLRFCYNHDSQLQSVELYGPESEFLIDVVDDRDALTVEEAAGQMVRIVDVPPALEAPAYAAEGRVVLDVSDDTAPWNDDRFALTVENGVATVDRTDAAPDVHVAIGTLSQLLVGYLSVDRARLVGDLTVDDPAAAETLAALFPTEETFLPESF
jgi:predicted acetyltransferase